MNTVRMTEYSHGAGCGCKISPQVLDKILKTHLPSFHDKHLLVGNDSRDDAAVYDIGNGQAIISTTDFFMPIVDDPFTFGKIAATNAISDIYAMGGKPIMAIAILGWPLDKLPEDIAQQVIDGGRSVCHEAGISLAGGHSIDTPEPLFGLAVTGMAEHSRLKQNNRACEGDIIYLTKPLGIGILTTAQKQKKLQKEHIGVAEEAMCQLNKIGADLALINGVTAMTDVTGFGLAGHLKEVCEGSHCAAEVDLTALPLLSGVETYLNLGCSPGGAKRNFTAYGDYLSPLDDYFRSIVCDPQTSGGLLVIVKPESVLDVERLFHQKQLSINPIGRIIKPSDDDSALIFFNTTVIE